MGVRVRTDPAGLLGVMAGVFLGSALIATFSLVVACVVKTRERFMGIGVDAQRTLLVGAVSADDVRVDFVVIAVVFALLVVAASRLYPGLAR